MKTTTETQISQQELQRRIFLNTMRSVYPDSIQLHYTLDADLGTFYLQPHTVEAKTRDMPDKAWADIVSRLNSVFNAHVRHRARVMNTTWFTMALFFTAFIGVAGVALRQMDEIWFQVTVPVLAAFVVLIVPNMCFTYFTIRPLLCSFEEWKRHVVIQFDKCGVEVIKVTTGEIVSGKATGWAKLLGVLWFGSAMWFRFEDARVEIFWRHVKSGKRVRRYSFIVATGAPVAETPSPIDAPKPHHNSPRTGPALVESVDEGEEEEEEALQSTSTLAST